MISSFALTMGKAVVVLALMLISMKGFSQTDLVYGNQYQLKGRIINEVSTPPDCGNLAWGIVVEFEIIEFSNPNYALDSIGIIFTCPEFYGKTFFETGNTYIMTIADENQASFSWVIPNASILSKYNLVKELWVVKAEKVNKK